MSLSADRLSGASSFPLENWWQQNFWEPTVALAIRDHCKAGDVVFDVGANAGGLSMIMSRLVGPRGVVIAIEASTRIIDKTQYNLVMAGCSNVTLLHRAVWRTTGAIVNIVAGTHFVNDRIGDGAGGMPVRTVALDDIAAAGDFRPSFIKMDIEGAEFDALNGMPRLLRHVRPTMVLEQSPEDMRCHELLLAAGYEAMDLGSYRRIRTAADFRPKTAVANVLFVPQEIANGSPYFSQIEPVIEATLNANRFTTAKNGDIGLQEPLTLPPGRYVIHADFTADGGDNEIFAGVEVDHKVVFRYHTYTRFMANAYTDWVVQLERPAQVAPYLRFVRGSDPTLRWKGVELVRLPAFDNWKAPVFD